jgi:hypothetical protein
MNSCAVKIQLPHAVGLAPGLRLDDENPAAADDHVINVARLAGDVMKHLGPMAFEFIKELRDLPFAVSPLL